MGLLSLTNIQDNDEATPDLFNSRFAAIAAILNGNLDASNIASGAIGTDELATGSVTSGKIATDAVKTTNFNVPYKFLVYRNAAWTSNNDIVHFDTKVFDTGNNVDIATNVGRFTAPVAGWYVFSANVTLNFASAGNAVRTILVKNSAAYIGGHLWVSTYNSAFDEGSVLPALPIQLAAGDYIEIEMNGGSATGSTGLLGTWFSGYMLCST